MRANYRQRTISKRFAQDKCFYEKGIIYFIKNGTEINTMEVFSFEKFFYYVLFIFALMKKAKTDID